MFWVNYSKMANNGRGRHWGGAEELLVTQPKRDSGFLARLEQGNSTSSIASREIHGDRNGQGVFGTVRYTEEFCTHGHCHNLPFTPNVRNNLKKHLRIPVVILIII